VQSNNPCNLLLAAVAEEEISGKGGVTSILNELPLIDLAIVGEPTQMQMAIAEKGLLVIDALANGLPGHAAHENTVNPILEACADIQTIHDHQFERVSPMLGKTKASVTVIHAGELHNQVPAECHFVVDVRVNELYHLEEVVEILQKKVASQLTPRSLRLKPSGINSDHLIIKVANDLNIQVFGSSTLSDQAVLPFPSIKIGPGESLRSHTADEFIYLSEIEKGIDKYIELITAYFTTQ
jgi:acetylornithine deacetylase